MSDRIKCLNCGAESFADRAKLVCHKCHDELFKIHENMMVQLCEKLGLDYTLVSESDVVGGVKELKNDILRLNEFYLKHEHICKEDGQLCVTASDLARSVEFFKREADALGEPMECGHFLANLQPTDGTGEVCMVCIETKELIGLIRRLRATTGYVFTLVEDKRLLDVLTEAMDDSDSIVKE